MSYNQKLTEYALLPKKAFPLDARSHFEDFGIAYQNINADTVTTVENSSKETSKKIYYAGQIITTTLSGTWQVVSPTSTMMLYFKTLGTSAKPETSATVYLQIPSYALDTSTIFNGISASANWGSNPVPDSVTLFSSTSKEIFAKIIVNRLYREENGIQYSGQLSTSLIPFSGGPGGGGGSLQLSPTGGLTNTNNGLSLKIADGKLSLSTDGLSLTDSYVTNTTFNSTLAEYTKKTYVDTQDATTLSSAKTYVDDKISKIDYTNYAKLNDNNTFTKNNIFNNDILVGIQNGEGTYYQSNGSVQIVDEYGDSQGTSYFPSSEDGGFFYLAYVTDGTIDRNLGSYATKTYVNDKISGIDFSPYVTKTSLDTTLGGYAKLSGSNKFTGSNEFSNRIKIGSWLFSGGHIGSIEAGNRLDFPSKSGWFAYASDEDSANLSLYARYTDLDSYAKKSDLPTGFATLAGDNEFTGNNVFSGMLTAKGTGGAMTFGWKSFVIANADGDSYGESVFPTSADGGTFYLAHSSTQEGADLSQYAKSSDLSSYVTNTTFNSTLSEYTKKTYVDTQDATTLKSAKDYTDSEIAKIDITSYVTNDSLITILGDYITKSNLSTLLGDYVTKSLLNSTLSSYVTSTALSTTLKSYSKTTEIDSKDATTLSNAKSYVDDKISKIDYTNYAKLNDNNTFAKNNIFNKGILVGIQNGKGTYYNDNGSVQIIDENGDDQGISYFPSSDDSGFFYLAYVTNDTIDRNLGNYATKAYTDEKISGIDLASYVTKTSLDSTLASYLKLSGGDMTDGAVVTFSHSSTSSAFVGEFSHKAVQLSESASGKNYESYLTARYINIGGTRYQDESVKITYEGGSTILNYPAFVNGWFAWATEAEDSDLSLYLKTATFDTKISSYVKQDSLTTTLKDYLTTSDFNSTIVNYAKLTDVSSEATLRENGDKETLTSSKSYTDDELTKYATKSSLETTLASYVTSSTLSDTLKTYVTSSELSNTLLNYATAKDLDNYVPLDGNVNIGGIKTFLAPTKASGEQHTTIFDTSNGGALYIGKEGPNSGTMLRFDQVKGTPRLFFRASATAGAMIWSQPEKGAVLYFDLTDSTGATQRTFLSPKTGGLLASPKGTYSDITASKVTVTNISIPNVSATTATASKATLKGTKTIGNANVGEEVSVGTSLTGTKTFVTGVTLGSLISNTTSTGGLGYLKDITFSPASATSTDTVAKAISGGSFSQSYNSTSKKLVISFTPAAVTSTSKAVTAINGGSVTKSNAYLHYESAKQSGTGTVGLDTSKIAPAVASESSISDWSFADVSTSKVTLGTAISASKVVATDVTASKIS